MGLEGRLLPPLGGMSVGRLEEPSVDLMRLR